MKRRLAWLLALSLTFASIPVAGVGAAEAATEEPAVVAEITEEAEDGETTETQTETVEAVQEEEEEAAPEEAAVVEEAAEQEEAQPAEEAEVPAEAATEEAAAVTEDDAEAITAEVAAEEQTATETAVGVEPIADADLAVKDTLLEDQVAAEKGWVEDSNGKWSYYGDDGKKVTGWLNLNGKYYYLGSDGIMRTGWQKIGSYWYYFNTAGDMAKGWKQLNGKWYYLESNGTMQIGWKNIGTNRYYFNAGGDMKQGWFKDGGNWYYLSMNGGAMKTGWQKINEKWYYFETNGAMQIGWKSIGGNWYYFNAGGDRHQGWLEYNGKWYYLSKNVNTPGVMKTGWAKPGEKWYYFNSDGAMLTGLRKLGQKWYYLAENGAMQTGWIKTPQGRYAYYTESGPAPAAGWKEKGDGNWYFLGEDGVAKLGWLSNNNYWFYLDETKYGRMCDEPKKIGDNIYFFYKENGHLASTKGWKYNGNYSYYTNAKGVCYTNTTIDGVKLDANGRSQMTAMDRKAQGYSSDTNYLILVDKSTFKVCVYKGKKGAWVKVKDWYCTHGGSDTPTGVFEIDEHTTFRSATYGWAVFDYSSAAFACHLSSGNWFHSILYEKYVGLNQPWRSPYDCEPMDPELKTTYSHGCIRLKTENAEWVWDNVPIGTKVVVYNS